MTWTGPPNGVFPFCLRTSGWLRCGSGSSAFRRRSSRCRCACAARASTTQRGAWWRRWMASYDVSTKVAFGKFTLGHSVFFGPFVIPPKHIFWYNVYILMYKSILYIQIYIYIDTLGVYLYTTLCLYRIFAGQLSPRLQVVIVFGLSTSMVMPLQRRA